MPRIDAVLRVFCSKPEDVPARVALVVEAVKSLHRSEGEEDEWLIECVHIVVWADARYDEADCGQTAAALEEAMKDDDGSIVLNQNVKILEFTKGDIYSSAGNFGLLRALQAGAEWVLTLSPEAHTYLTPGVIRSLLDASQDKNCHAAGVALKEVEETVREGRLASTFAMWRLDTFFQVGGFPMSAARRPPGWGTPEIEVTANDGQYRVPLQGVEEVPLLLGVAMLLGHRFIRIISTEGGKYTGGGWSKAWQDLKFLSKRMRQDAYALRLFGLVHGATPLREYIIHDD